MVAPSLEMVALPGGDGEQEVKGSFTLPRVKKGKALSLGGFQEISAGSSVPPELSLFSPLWSRFTEASLRAATKVWN